MKSLCAAAIIAAPTAANAQTGVDDDRVSLPEGPGSLEGVGENVDIDPNMGAMSYGVPFNLPSGYNGFSPSLGLSYSSSAGSSTVGVGWSMSVPSIERFTARGTPKYATSDVFAVGGGRELVMISSGDDKQVYRERFEGAFTRYTWHKVGQGSSGYWTAEYGDGSVAYFGADSDGNLVSSARSEKEGGDTYKYHLVERVDPYGHKITYGYDKLDSNWPLLSQIAYVFEGDVPVYQVDLTYEERSDLLSDAGAGYEELLRHRLASVRVSSKTSLIREYVLSYESYQTSGGFSRLENVTRYGVGGQANGEAYPINFTFGYSGALGAECASEDCEGPYVVSMGTQSAATGLASGKATLVDINADGLPDLVDTTNLTAHRILFNRLTVLPDGSTRHTLADPVESAIGLGANFALGGENVTQTLDVNGDGLSDLLNTRTGTSLVAGYGLADWSGEGDAFDVSALAAVAIEDAKFMDYNNDKLIDVIVSTASSTVVYENTGGGFVAKTVNPIGVPLAGNDRVHLADMNGDGYNDVVEVQGSGSMRFRINYGWGEFSEWRAASGVQIPASDLDKVDLEDLNGDGISDVVVVSSTQVRYAINRNGSAFDAFETITSSDIAGDLPVRSEGDVVLYADMNANGSEDIVWFDASGEVKYLELFPVRPNLLSRIDNGIGSIQKVSYTTSALQEASARADGSPWTRSLSLPMNIVESTDTFVTLTGDEDGQGLHDVTRYTYRDGFYDGVEKQFRGFQTVFVELSSSDAQEGGAVKMVYDLGDTEPHRNGLLLEQETTSGGRLLGKQTKGYQDCDLTGVPSPSELIERGQFPVKFACLTSDENLIVEGGSDADSVSTRSTYQYDGWGNVTLSSMEGVIDEAGDELYEEMTYNDPTSSERWFVGLPLTASTYTIEGGAIRTLTSYYYDGQPFVGSQDQITHGFVSRVTDTLDEATTRETSRAARDEHGNVVRQLDALGTIEDESAHSRRYEYNDFGLFPQAVEIHVKEGHKLRREMVTSLDFQRPIRGTDWVYYKDDVAMTPENASGFVYDDFGRLTQRQLPGDDANTPTTSYTYELGEPFSRIVTRQRSSLNGAIDEESYTCVDGLGRTYQTRVKDGAGAYLVSGFQVYNSRGASVESFQSYTSPSADCESARPSNVLSVTTKYDAMFRPVELSEPAEELYGEPLLTRTEYRPLVRAIFDAEDLDGDSAHFDTPTLYKTDGLGRVREITRTSAGGQMATYEVFYDETNSFAGYTDPEGNRHELVVDLLGRISAVRNPTIGEHTFEYDVLGNMVSKTDARGVVTNFSYDGANRLTGRWDASDVEGTKIEYLFDEVPAECEFVDCTNPANRLTQISYVTPWGASSEHFGYDSRGRALFSSRNFAGVIDMRSTTNYDNVGRALSVTFPDGTTLATEFDSIGRPVSVGGYLDTIRYSERGLPEGLSFNNGAVTEMSYDALMRLESVINKDAAGKIIEGLVLERDRVENITAISDMSEIGGLTHDSTFEYDSWYRTTSASQGTEDALETMTYEFDVLDRLTGATSSLGADSAAHLPTITYDSERPLAIAAAGDVTFAYDLAGQVIKRGDLELTWDFMNRISEATKGSAKQTHIYGADKERVAIVGEDSLTIYGLGDFDVRDGVSYTYVRAFGQKVARHADTSLMPSIYNDADADGEITAADAWLGRDATAEVSTQHVLGAAAARMLAEREDKKAFLHNDHLGSIVSATDEGGELRGRRLYNTSGVVRAESGFVDYYGFTGQEHNEFTGFIQYAMRDFDPITTRWTSFDPNFTQLNVGQMSSLGEATTGYAYVGNNFANFVDPTGLEKDKPKGNKARDKRPDQRKEGERMRRPSATSSDAAIAKELNKNSHDLHGLTSGAISASEFKTPGGGPAGGGEAAALPSQVRNDRQIQGILAQNQRDVHAVTSGQLSAANFITPRGGERDIVINSSSSNLAQVYSQSIPTAGGPKAPGAAAARNQPGSPEYIRNNRTRKASKVAILSSIVGLIGLGATSAALLPEMLED